MTVTIINVLIMEGRTPEKVEALIENVIVTVAA
jgi:hypothetical protein